MVRPGAIAALGIGELPVVPASGASNVPRARAKVAPKQTVAKAGTKAGKGKAAVAGVPVITPAPDPDTMRRVVGGFLDDQSDTDLAQRFGRPKRGNSGLAGCL